ncbi:MAG TPA: ester cyclase [Gemmatimonadaceae bacterium]
MSAQTNETLVRSIFEAFNTRNFDEAAKLVSDTSEYRNAATGEVFPGPDGTRQYMQYWANAFDDAKVEIKRIIATDKFVVTEFIGRGTHTGPLETPAGSIPPTHRTVELPSCEIVSIEKGKVTSGVMYFDTATLLQQLGVHELAGAHK